MLDVKNYLRPDSLDEFVKYSKEDYVIIAGGTDIVPRLNLSKAPVSTVIDVSSIKDFKKIEKTNDCIFIGSAVTFTEIINESKITDKGFKMLQEAVSHVSCVQIRNVGTIGGNICNGSPCGDSLPSLLALNANCLFYSEKGYSEKPLNDILFQPRKTKIDKGSVLVGVKIPLTSDSVFADCSKYSIRGDVEIALVNLAVTISKKGNTIEKAAVAAGGLAPRTIRFPELEALLEGKSISDNLISEVCKKSASCCAPITDLRATKEYRTTIFSYLLEQSLKKFK